MCRKHLAPIRPLYLFIYLLPPAVTLPPPAVTLPPPAVTLSPPAVTLPLAFLSSLFQCLFIVHWGFALVFYLWIYYTFSSLTSLLYFLTLSTTLYCLTAVSCSYTDVMYFNIIQSVLFFSSFLLLNFL
jgi:hypothetical protein